jgi:hypothetical protein
MAAMTKWLLAAILLGTPMGHAAELWDHLSSASELVDVRDMAASFDDSGARRALHLNVSNPVSWQQGAWVAVPPPAGGWDLANVQHVQAAIKNTGSSAVETMLWVVASNGWAAVGSEITLGAGQTATLSCNLRQTYPDGTPRIDPNQIKHIRIMTQRAATASLEVTGLSATGKVDAWVRPAGHLAVPDMIEGEPAAGRRVRYRLADDAGTDIYCALYLPTDWQPGNRYPVIAETPGNYFYSASSCWSTGRPEQCAMGYGMSSGTNAIWVSLPFVDCTAGTIAENGFGSNTGADTVTYVQDLIDDICQNWGGDTNNLFLCGFSRGAIACGYIGLANDDIAALWKGFIACQHYDGSAWKQSNMAGAITRALRFQGEAIFQVDNSNKAANYEQLMDHTDPSVEWTWTSSGLGYHSTAMFLDDRDMMVQLRQWFAGLITE